MLLTQEILEPYDCQVQPSRQPDPLIGAVLDGRYRVDAPIASGGMSTVYRGLDTRLDPGVLRPITFDPAFADGRPDLVYVHLGHPIVQKAQRLLRRSLWSADSSLSRVTAVVVDDLPESFVAAVI